MTIDDLAAATQRRPVVPRPDEPHRRGAAGAGRAGRARRADPAGLAAGQAARLLRRPARPPLGHPRSRRPRAGARRPGSDRSTRPSTPARPSSRPSTPYHYSTYEDETEVRPSTRPKVVILGSGPNRIGQGIEFDYCCVHASLRPAGGRVRDGDGQLQPRDRLHRLRHVRPPLLRAADGGGRTERPRRGDRGLGRCRPVGGRRPGRPDPAQAGRSPAAGADRRHQPGRHRPGRGPRALERGLQPTWASRSLPAASASSLEEALAITDRVGYPVLVRPSYVLGGRAMQICYDAGHLKDAMAGLFGFGLFGFGDATTEGGGAWTARAGCRPSARSSSTASSRTRSRSTSTPSATPPARCSSVGSWSTSRRPASTAATRPAPSHRPRSSPGWST